MSRDSLSSDAEALVERLAADLEPVRRVAPAWLASCLWLGATWGAVLAFLAWTGGFRPGLGQQLATSLPFAAQLVLGFVASVGLAHAAYHLSIPGAEQPTRAKAFAIGSFLLVVASYGIALWWPYLEPSMVGKREDCHLEVLAIGLVGLLTAVPSLSRRVPRPRSLILAGTAASKATRFSLITRILRR